MGVPWVPGVGAFSCSPYLELTHVYRNNSYNDFHICSIHAFIRDAVSARAGGMKAMPVVTPLGVVT